MVRENASSAPLEIVVKDLYKSFGENPVLRGIDLSICREELVAIVGTSGCGKTVLVRQLIGLLRPDKGEVWVASHESAGSSLVNLFTLDEAGMDRLRVQWSVVFQGNALFTDTVERNVSLPLELIKGTSRADAIARVRSAIETVGLDPDQVLSMQRDALSGGMAKCVAIARALVTEPLLIYFDEPTSGLDPVHAALIQDLIFKTYLQRQNGVRRTTVIVTHDKDLIYRLQPRIVMLHEGRVFFDGNFADFARSESPIIRPNFDRMAVLNNQMPASG